MTKPEEPWRQLISSGLKGDLVVLFRKNPGIMDILDGVARRLGAQVSEIEQEVSDLVALGFLKKKKIGQHDVFYLNEERDKEIQDSVARYLVSLKKEKGS